MVGRELFLVRGLLNAAGLISCEEEEEEDDDDVMNDDGEDDDLNDVRAWLLK